MFDTWTHTQCRVTQCEPNFHSVAGEQRSRKRKSPCVAMPLFRYPLSSGMQLSQRTHLPGKRLRSPSVRHGKSPAAATKGQGKRSVLDIDLNVEPKEDAQVIVDSGFDPEADPNALVIDGSGFDP